jgi:hypothetical protein
MDVTFKEDASLVRKSHADDNLPTVRRWALNLCRLDQTPTEPVMKIRTHAA